VPGVSDLQDDKALSLIILKSPSKIAFARFPENSTGAKAWVVSFVSRVGSDIKQKLTHVSPEEADPLQHYLGDDSVDKRVNLHPRGGEIPPPYTSKIKKHFDF